MARLWLCKGLLDSHFKQHHKLMHRNDISITSTKTKHTKNVANCLLTEVTKVQISKYWGPDVSILAGTFSKAE